MPVRTVDRPKPLILISPCIRAVRCRDEDHVTFIALHVFKVLDEQGLRAVVHSLLIGNGKGLGLQTAIKKFFNQLSLLKIERNHAEGFGRPIAHVVQDRLDNRRGFRSIAPFVEDACMHLVVLDAKIRALVKGRREDDQVA